jgi:hypothetical protein
VAEKHACAYTKCQWFGDINAVVTKQVGGNTALAVCVLVMLKFYTHAKG